MSQFSRLIMTQLLFALTKLFGKVCTTQHMSMLLSVAVAKLDAEHSQRTYTFQRCKQESILPYYHNRNYLLMNVFKWNQTVQTLVTIAVFFLILCVIKIILFNNISGLTVEIS